MKEISFAVSTLVYMACCLYYSVFCAFNGISQVGKLLWEIPGRNSYSDITDGVYSYLFLAHILCILVCAVITAVTKADLRALALWSAAGLSIVAMTDGGFTGYVCLVSAFLFLAVTAYSVFAFCKMLKEVK